MEKHHDDEDGDLSGAIPPAHGVMPCNLISILEAAEATGRSPQVLLAIALRRPEEIPVYVQPEAPGWRAVQLQADSGPRKLFWRHRCPGEVYDEVLTEPIPLAPDVLRDVMATGLLRRVTIDGLPIGASREEVGHTQWSIDLRGQVHVEAESAVMRRYHEVYALCQAQRVLLESLLIPRKALRHLSAPSTQASTAASSAPPPLPPSPAGPQLRAETLYDRDDAAAILRVTSRTINRWIKNGTIASSKVGGRRLIKGADILARLEPPAPPQPE